MRVLFVTPLYWPDTSGATRLVQGYAERLAVMGHTVHVWTTDAAENRALYSPEGARAPGRRVTHQGVRIHRFPLWHPPDKERAFSRAFRLPWPGSGYAFDAPHVCSVSMQLAAATTRASYDVVIAGYLPFTSFLHAGSVVAARRKAAFVIIPLLHLGEPGDETMLASFGRPLQRRVLQRADVLLANTEVEASALRRWGMEARRIAVVGAGIEPEDLRYGVANRFRKKYGLVHPVVFQISTQTHDKGSHHLVEAMKQVWGSGIDAHLVLVGTSLPDFDDYLSHQPKEVFERLVCTGHLSEQAKIDLLAAGDIMVMVSRAESFGIAFLEAWFWAKPVIGCYAGALPAMIWDGVDGFLVPFADVHMLAEYLRILLMNPELRRRLGEAGQAKVLSSYLWEQRMERLVRALNLVNHRGR